MTKHCACGSPFDVKGQCMHCDKPVSCPTGCVACRTRDSRCEVCRTDCGTPVGATYHQKKCREAENRSMK